MYEEAPGPPERTGRKVFRREGPDVPFPWVRPLPDVSHVLDVKRRISCPRSRGASRRCASSMHGRDSRDPCDAAVLAEHVSQHLASAG